MFSIVKILRLKARVCEMQNNTLYDEAKLRVLLSELHKFCNENKIKFSNIRYKVSPYYDETIGYKEEIIADCDYKISKELSKSRTKFVKSIIEKYGCYFDLNYVGEYDLNDSNNTNNVTVSYEFEVTL